MNRRQLFHLASFAALGATSAIASAGPQATQPATQPAKDTKRVIPVKNVVPTGASPIHNPVLRIEVIEALDFERPDGAGWRTKVVVRVKNARDDRVRCRLSIRFDGELFDSESTVDLVGRGVDLDLYADYGGDGKRSEQLSKLTAEARDIRIGG